MMGFANGGGKLYHPLPTMAGLLAVEPKRCCHIDCERLDSCARGICLVGDKAGIECAVFDAGEGKLRLGHGMSFLEHVTKAIISIVQT